MAEHTKTEVNLEICSGFFRIPTENLIFNITVLESEHSSTTRVVEKIVEVEKEVPVAAPAPPPQPSPAPATAPQAEIAAAQPADDFYQKTSEKCAADLKSLSESLGEEVGGNETPEGVEDLSAMATDLKNVLLNARKLTSSRSGGGGGGVSTAILQELAEKLSQAETMSSGNKPSKEVDVAAPAPPTAATKKLTRHLFGLDAIFQTMYELCTNETVKTHIQNARGKAEEIFDKEKFYDIFSPKVSGYSEDDGFFNIPMSDIYKSLAQACSDKAVINLLKKMDQQQAEIFLDQFLPLEVPATEEIEVPDGSAAAAIPAGKTSPPPKGAGTDMAILLQACKALVEKALDGADGNAPTEENNSDDALADALNDAITITGSIIDDATQLADSGNLDGGDNFESTLWYKIKQTSTFYTSMLTQKLNTPDSTFDDALKAGAEGVQTLKAAILAQVEAARPKAPEPVADAGGEASQDDIDRLLEEMGG